MSIAISSTIESQIKKLSERFGINEKEFVQNAITSYLDDISPYLNLKEELSLWEKASDEDLIKFENAL